MQNLFYVPPYQPQDVHPKPRGVRTVIKRNQPTRLDLALPVTGHPYFVYVPAPAPILMTKPRRTSRIKTALGRLLIHIGQRLVPDETGDTLPPLGQPA